MTSLRWQRSSPCAKRPEPPSCHKAATPGLSAEASPSPARSCSACAGWPASTDVDPLGGQLSVGAGTTVAEVQAAAASAGWAYGVDLASRDSATIGGTIATNAGGLQVLRHGSTRAQLVGFEAVLGTGETVSHMGGLIKDNTGYDLGGLLCGSEGTLGLVTAARVRLVPQSPERVTAILAFSSTAAAVDAASLLRRSLPELQSLEFFLQPGLDLVCRTSGIAAPFPNKHRAYLLAEAASQHDPMPAMAAVLDSLTAVEDVAVATDPSQEGTAVALSRRPHRGDQHARCAPQARRDAAGPHVGRLHRRRTRRREGCRPKGHDVALRSRRRWQRPRQRDRARTGRLRPSTTASCTTSPSSVAASAPSTASERRSDPGSTSTGAKRSSRHFEGSRRHSILRAS